MSAIASDLRGGLGILLSAKNITSPSMVDPELRKHRIDNSAAVFVKAGQWAKRFGMSINARSWSHFEIVDGVRSVHVFVAEQDIGGKWGHLMHGRGQDWDIFDVVRAYIDSKDRLTAAKAVGASAGMRTADEIERPVEKKRKA